MLVALGLAAALAPMASVPTVAQTPSPRNVETLDEVVAVAAGAAHSLALRRDGTVWAWGWNEYGQLGEGTWQTSPVPVQVQHLSGVKAIAAGGFHSLAVKSDGTLWAWGDNAFGQLGDGTTENRWSPVQVLGLSQVTSAAAGGAHSLALASDGGVWAWGRNNRGQLGDGTATNRPTPGRVEGITDARAVAAGFEHSLAAVGGKVWAWGDNAFGQLGDDTTQQRRRPVAVSGLGEVKGLAAGWGYSLALAADGSLSAWGRNANAELGDGSTIAKRTPVAVGELAGIRSISAGSQFGLGVAADGSFWAWGNNGWGQLGDGSRTTRTRPVSVPELAGVTAVAGGGNHSLAAHADGSLSAWGWSPVGQLGTGRVDSYGGVSGEQLTTGGRDRWYHLYVPSRYEPEPPAPLVIVLEATNNGGGIVQTTGFNDLAEEHGFIVVYPHSTLRRIGQFQWHGGDRADVDDVGYIEELLDLLESEYGIDPRRIYVTGWSAGASMSYTVACAFPGRIAAAATAAGFGSCQRSRALPVLSFAGTADTNASIEGARRAVERWGTANGCGTELEEVVDESVVSRETRGGCRDGAEVVLYTIEGGGHQWPGPRAGDAPSRAIDASSVIWDFFQRHPMRE